MAQLGELFKDSGEEIVNKFEVLPVGWYTATIAETKLVPTRAGTGQVIKVRYDITGPSHQGRVVWQNINWRNPSAQAQEIGGRQLMAVMRATGIVELEDTDQLVGTNLRIKLSVKKSTNPEYPDDKNEITACESIEGSALPQAETKTNSTPKKAAPPWAK